MSVLKSLSFIALLLNVVGTALLLSGAGASAQQETVLYSFNNFGSDGSIPLGGLAFDSVGNLYGTTGQGGATGCGGNGCGTVFQLTPQAGGGWSEKVLHNFNDRSTDGDNPYGTLVLDGSGNLYGTTRGGGAAGCGTVFEISPQANGTWSESILHSFANSSKDGCAPYAGVILDAAGNVYGTTSAGGQYAWGVVFELSPSNSGHWNEKLLHVFGKGNDGWAPESALVMDAAGNLYGTTVYGGSRTLNESGTVFELLPQANGTWQEKILVNFPADGSFPQNPQSALIFDQAGNLYGTSYSGGKNGRGSVFELSPKSGGGWTQKLLHSFSSTLGDGQGPVAGVVMDAAGNLYGTTSGGGTTNESEGVVYKLTPQAGGWTETLLYDFTSNGASGSGPFSGVILDAAGNLYGTTQYGGTYLRGAVYEISQ